MIELIFETFIGRDVEFVFDNLYKREVFRKWGTAFSPDPKYIGVISKGNIVKFGDDDNNAMTAVVSKYIENKEILFTYTEQTVQGKIIPLIGMSEEYDFTIANAEAMVLTVKLIVPKEWEEIMNEMWSVGIINIKNTIEEL